MGVARRTLGPLCVALLARPRARASQAPRQPRASQAPRQPSHAFPRARWAEMLARRRAPRRLPLRMKVQRRASRTAPRTGGASQDARTPLVGSVATLALAARIAIRMVDANQVARRTLGPLCVALLARPRARASLAPRQSRRSSSSPERLPPAAWPENA